jgi:putative pyruvate formate lyase activating enzyme
MADERIQKLKALQSPCRLCPRECRVRRDAGDVGFCGAGADAVVASFGPHYGEESCLVGSGGSGAIFLAGCNLKCAFCQNFDISQHVDGDEMTPDRLARLMLALESRGCENVNFVTPTHFAPQIAEAIVEARGRGLSVPIVYNCGGYESVEALRLLSGLVEVYMPDAKFMSADSSARYLDARDYPERMREAITEMHRQVGYLVIEDGVATRGLLVRHLVMPGHAEDSKTVMDFLAQLSRGTFVNVMGQYRPLFRAEEFSEINRRPHPDEVNALRAYALRKGLRVDG